MAHYRGHHLEIMKLLRLDGNAAFADVDLDASGLLPLLVELIAQDHDGNDERADNKVENVVIHRSAAFFCFALDARILRREQIFHRPRSVAHHPRSAGTRVTNQG